MSVKIGISIVFVIALGLLFIGNIIVDGKGVSNGQSYKEDTSNNYDVGDDDEEDERDDTCCSRGQGPYYC